jgi:4-hydroxy-tetrahydrodipicolinate synthase
VKEGDLHKAMKIQGLITPIKEAVYGAGEPTGEAHARMKAAMKFAGVLESAHVRPPTHAPSAAENELIRLAVANAGLLK